MAQPGSAPQSLSDHHGPSSRTGRTDPSTTSRTPCTGRFAPSPTGPLHTGSLIAALASYLDARSREGLWLVRMEDLDPPREQAGAADLILHQLDTLGLHWDGTVLYQSTRIDAYREALARLESQGLLYYCTCTRQTLREHGNRYPGFCRHRHHPLPRAAIRCRLDNLPAFSFEDLYQGTVIQSPDDEGDLVVLRKDGLFAYQLAVVVDDAFQGVDRVIRGIDLLDSCARQHALQQYLGFPAVTYGHVPLLVDADGHKLSKQNGAAPIELSAPGRTLTDALILLGQKPEPGLEEAGCEEILHWAAEHWNPEALKGRQMIPA